MGAASTSTQTRETSTLQKQKTSRHNNKNTVSPALCRKSTHERHAAMIRARSSGGSNQINVLFRLFWEGPKKTVYYVNRKKTRKDIEHK